MFVLFRQSYIFLGKLFKRNGSMDLATSVHKTIFYLHLLLQKMGNYLNICQQENNEQLTIYWMEYYIMVSVWCYVGGS